MFKFNSKKKDKKSKPIPDEEELAINSILSDQVEDANSNPDDSDVPMDDDDDGILQQMIDGQEHASSDEEISSGEVELTSENSTDDGDVIVGDLEIHSIDHIEKIAKEASRKGPGKIIVIILGVLFVILMAMAAIMLFSANKDTPKENIPVATPVPTEDIFADADSSTITPLTQYGEVKRLLNDKIIIRPDNSLSDTIYFVTDATEEKNINSLDIGKRVEYTYTIVDSKNIFISFKDIYSGTVLSVGENRVILTTSNDEVIELRFQNALVDTFNQITSDDIIEYTLSDSDMIGSISNIIKPNAPTVNGKPEFVNKADSQIETPDFNPADWTAEYEAIANKTPGDVNKIEMTSDFENNSVKFYNSFGGPIWIRFAWKINEYVSAVPSVDQVNVSLITPDGATISYSNINDYGRMWIDGNIINYAIEDAPVGEWTLKADKNIGFYLGQSNFMLMSLTGFITIDKFGVNNNGDGQLEFIWNIGGVEDPNYAIKIEIVSDKFTTTLYTATSKTTDLSLIDSTIVNAKSIPKGTYNVRVTVQDIDIYTAEDNPEIAEHTRMVGAETIIQRYDAGQLVIN